MIPPLMSSTMNLQDLKGTSGNAQAEKSQSKVEG